MNKIKKTLPKPFSDMLENFNLAKETIPPSRQKSNHWDVFPEDYEKSMEEIEAWKTFLRNPLSLGFNDVLVNYDNSRFNESKKYKGIDAWQNRKNHNYSDLIEDFNSNPEDEKLVTNIVSTLFSLSGADFVKNYSLDSEIGSPQKFLISSKLGSFHCNLHDLLLIYYFWQISRAADIFFETDSPVIAEIGPGYGGLITKTKKRYPKARIILFDLPEPGAVQTYYIYNTYPNSKILYLKDLLERGNKVFDEEFDFMILPGWMINQVPDKYFDLVINMRSMMEMSLNIIDYYFNHIHRSVKNNGLFACHNRYHKKPHGEEEIMMKHYPFDEYWIPVISQTSVLQGHIHDLILKRQDRKSDFHIKDILKSLPPYK